MKNLIQLQVFNYLFHVQSSFTKNLPEEDVCADTRLMAIPAHLVSTQLQ